MADYREAFSALAGGEPVSGVPELMQALQGVRGMLASPEAASPEEPPNTNVSDYFRQAITGGAGAVRQLLADSVRGDFSRPTKRLMSGLDWAGRNVALPALQKQEELFNTDWSKQPLIGLGEGGELTGRLPGLASFVAPSLVGGAPGGSLSAGIRYPGAPPHVQTPAQLRAWRDNMTNMALEGTPGRFFYENSGRDVADLSGVVPGGDLTRAIKLAEGLGITSPQTKVPANAEYAVRGHNMAMTGDPIQDVGFFKNAMSDRLNRTYFLDEPWAGRKTNTFSGNILNVLDPTFGRGIADDFWMMEAGGYPSTKRVGGHYTGTPTQAQYNFMENEVGGPILNRLNETVPAGEAPWLPHQAQAGIWATIRARALGLDPQEAGFDFSNAFDQMRAQHSYETIPGRTTGHMPEAFNADPKILRDMHREIVDAITDPQGRDLLNQHFGLLTGKTFDAPGAFEGRVSPGSQAPVIGGKAMGSAPMLLDPHSREMIDTSAYARALLLGQDAVGWNRPFFRQGDKLSQRNLIDIDIGRPMTEAETMALYNAMEKHSKGDFAPIGTPNGARLLNVPDYSNIDHVAFQKYADSAVKDVFGGEGITANVTRRVVDNGYQEVPWEGILKDGSYLSGAPTRRPDLLRRIDDILSALGPKVSAIQDRFANQYGWTVNPATRLWQRPGLLNPDPATRNVFPLPPAPWESRMMPGGALRSPIPPAIGGGVI